MENNPISVSVIVPCYNVQDYIVACVDSILKQTYKNIQVILVDDGSTDNTPSLCDSYSDKNNFTILHTPNGGLSVARNNGLEVATGDYVVFVDSDDEIHEKYIETLLNVAIRFGVDCVVSHYTPTLNGSPADYKQISSEPIVMPPMKAIENMFYQELFDTNAHCKLFRRNLLSNPLFEKGYIYEDLISVYCILLACESVAYCDCKLYSYRILSTSIEGRPFSEKKLKSYHFAYNKISSDPRLAPIANAVRCRMFSFTCRIYFDMPDNHTDKPLLWNRIKQNRWAILRNGSARRKARYAALLSYLGKPLFKFIYSKVKVR